MMKSASMIIAALFIAVSLAMALSSAQTEPSNACKVQAVGVMVTKGIPAKGYENHGSSTSVTLLISSTQDFLVDLDASNSKVSKFFDDCGSKLDSNDVRIITVPTLAQPGDVEPTGHDLPIDIASSVLPAKGATQIHLKASVALFCSKTVKTMQHKMPLRPGSELTFEKMTLRIKTVAAEDESSVCVTFVGRGSPQSVRSFKRIDFADAAGKPIESVLSFEGGGNEDNEKIITGEWQNVLKTKAAEVTASVSYYSDVHSVQVPIDVTVGLGL